MVFIDTHVEKNTNNILVHFFTLTTIKQNSHDKKCFKINDERYDKSPSIVSPFKDTYIKVLPFFNSLLNDICHDKVKVTETRSS